MSITQKRHSIIEGEIAKIPLGVNAKDGYAIVDKEFSWLDKYNWCVQVSGYAYNDKLKVMHHNIIGKPKKGFEIDHKNNNRLDNRGNNLRIITHHQNTMNKSINKTNKYGLKGITRDCHKWKAQIGINRKRINLGRYNTPEEAAKAYNKAAIIYFGEYACLNKIK